jgi:hypothetical protein
MAFGCEEILILIRGLVLVSNTAPQCKCTLKKTAFSSEVICERWLAGAMIV